MDNFPFTPEELLPLLKIDLAISAEAFDERLKARIQTAMERITREGCTRTDAESDRDLVLMYAAYLWRERVTGAEMPRMLRYALNNRVLGQAAEVTAT